jgi:hypothetical protein
MGQFFEHIGFTIAGEWYIIGESHNSEVNSTQGVLKDIRGRPDKKDLAKVRRDVNKIIRQIRSSSAS